MIHFLYQFVWHDVWWQMDQFGVASVDMTNHTLTKNHITCYSKSPVKGIWLKFHVMHEWIANLDLGSFASTYSLTCTRLGGQGGNEENPLPFCVKEVMLGLSNYSVRKVHVIGRGDSSICSLCRKRNSGHIQEWRMKYL